MTATAILRRIWHLRRAYQLAARCCPPGGRPRLMAKAARLVAADLAPGRRVRVTTLDLGRMGRVEVRDFSQLLVLWEVFVAGVYDMPELPAHAEVIVDCGCNVGASLIWFHSRYPAASIVGYEADPITADLARRNTAGLPGVEIHPLALAPQDGEVTFHRVPGQSWASGTCVEGGSALTVPALALDSVVRRAGGRIDILKLDIEGAEHEVLAAATRLDRVRLLVGEYHPAPGASWETLRRSLDGMRLRPASAADEDARTFAAWRWP